MSSKDRLPCLMAKDLGLGEKDGIMSRRNSSVNIQKIRGFGGLEAIVALSSRYFL